MRKISFFLSIILLMLSCVSPVIACTDGECDELHILEAAETEIENSAVAAAIVPCNHTLAYSNWDSNCHREYCTKGCGYETYPPHERPETCAATSCAAPGCTFEFPAIHVYDNEQVVYIGDYLNDNRHAFLCTGYFDFNCGGMYGASLCTEYGNRSIQGWTYDDKHPIYQTCSGCGTDIIVDWLDHIPDGACYDFCEEQGEK